MKEVTVISVTGSNASMRASMLSIHQQGRTLDTREVLFPGLVLVYRLQALQAVGPNGVQRLGSLKVCKDRGMNHFRHTNHKAARRGRHKTWRSRIPLQGRGQARRQGSPWESGSSRRSS